MDIKQHIDKAVEWQRERLLNWLGEELRLRLLSQDAKLSYVELNNLFESRGLVDEDGNPIRVGDPAELVHNIEIKDGELHIALTEDEERWIRADQVFGRKILDGLNIKHSMDANP